MSLKHQICIYIYIYILDNFRVCLIPGFLKLLLRTVFENIENIIFVFSKNYVFLTSIHFTLYYSNLFITNLFPLELEPRPLPMPTLSL